MSNLTENEINQLRKLIGEVPDDKSIDQEYLRYPDDFPKLWGYHHPSPELREQLDQQTKSFKQQVLKIDEPERVENPEPETNGTYQKQNGKPKEFNPMDPEEAVGYIVGLMNMAHLTKIEMKKKFWSSRREVFFEVGI